jgi:hypothetical protein
MIRVNLRDNWREYIEAEAPTLGLRYSVASALEQNTDRAAERSEAKLATIL